jgi:hypothetical protein
LPVSALLTGEKRYGQISIERIIVLLQHLQLSRVLGGSDKKNFSENP